MRARRCTAAAAVLFVLTPCGFAAAQSARNVLVVANQASGASERIAEYYARKRAIPDAQILRLRAPATEEVDRAIYVNAIERPIAAWLSSHTAQDRTLFIVLTKDIPLRIAGSGGPNGTVASVDSELALLYRRMTGRQAPVVGKVENPYFAAGAMPGALKHFSHRVADIYLVTRLDAYTEAEATALVDRALTPAHSGKIVLDERGSADSPGDQWLEHAAETLRTMGAGNEVVLDRTAAVAKRELGVLGYYSWGSNDPAIKSRHTDMAFVPGAIAAMYVSSDARTFHAPPADWTLGDWNNRASYFGGSPQSLTGDLLRDGATGAAGHVAEPYLDATIRPNVLFPAYLSGFNLAEAFYQAMPYLSWQTVVVGDPLCSPVEGPSIAADESDPPIDPTTELPRFFSERQIAISSTGGTPRTAAAALVKGQARLGRGDKAGARAALEDALKIDPRLTIAERVLAQLDEEDQRYASAIERYRRVLQVTPNDVVVLNNLAFTMATRTSKPADALPFAERAAALAPGSSNVLDTLGWVCHLAGDDKRADTWLERARQSGEATVDIWVHSAEVHVALGNTAGAAQDLDAAVKADPSAASREDVVRLRHALSRHPA